MVRLDEIQLEMLLERIGIEPTVENRLMWFGYIERIHVDFIIRRSYSTENSQITRSRGS